ncbi:hypothetical protein [Vibrio nitrifigilis]|uniref:Uncharacterized protein n=1 Tax=Vibrio nitrifigilis TaxID=2789781 RepID=A0ABS0GF23_9VIBR|nr:hypothetical protein [Vibrio nitrifigilis]MBF9001009.1 hypothetical protein [Vibrio nitrifigilis]
MMSTRKEYVLQDKNHFHAHIEVTRCGTIAIDIPETQEHFETELDCIEWQSKNGASCLICVSETQAKKKPVTTSLVLHKKDARDLDKLIAEAEEDYELLMNDLL